MIDVLGGISKEEFLREYWQKKPLLIRQAFPGFECPVSPDELAGLSCEEDIESRLVIENNDGKPWDLIQGPFDDTHFESLPPTHWTLLIQGLDTIVPEISDLLDHFRFIPNWRIDDVMASYAPEHGSVGPHFDFYDVFLLQARGKRRWQTGQHCDEQSPRLDGTCLRILETFETINDWVLEPGDMLYLPPQLAHHGVSQGDCITLSIGFRSPNHSEIWSSFADHVCSKIEKEIHLDDPGMTVQDNPGEISDQTISKIRDIITQYVSEDAVSEWFGEHSTEPKSEHTVIPADEAFTQQALRAMDTSEQLIRWNEGSRFCYYFVKNNAKSIKFFYDGNERLLDQDLLPLVQGICKENTLAPEITNMALKSTEQTALLIELLNGGHLFIDE